MRAPLGFNRMSTDRGIDTRVENAAGSEFYVTSNKYAIDMKREWYIMVCCHVCLNEPPLSIAPLSLTLIRARGPKMLNTDA